MDPFCVTNADVLNNVSDLLTLAVQQLLKIGGVDAIRLFNAGLPISHSRAATLFFLVAANQVQRRSCVLHACVPASPCPVALVPFARQPVLATVAC